MGPCRQGPSQETKQFLHTKFVEHTINNQGNHPLLGVARPEIDKSECDLPRPYRAIVLVFVDTSIVLVERTCPAVLTVENVIFQKLMLGGS